MIKIVNENDIEELELYNKIYIPQENINQNWTYKMNGDYITIITNQNCRTQYNTTYCTCRLYNWKTNITSIDYECSTNNNNPTIPYESITSNVNYSNYLGGKYQNSISVLLLMIIIGIIFAGLMTRRRYN